MKDKAHCDRHMTCFEIQSCHDKRGYIIYNYITGIKTKKIYPVIES